jgi:hypothetical protein
MTTSAFPARLIERAPEALAVVAVSQNDGFGIDPFLLLPDELHDSDLVEPA